MLSTAAGVEPEPLLKVICRPCGRSIAVVHRTPHGPLWVGYLRNPAAQQLHSEDSRIAQWLDHRLMGECRCRVPYPAPQPGWPDSIPRLHYVDTDEVKRALTSGKRRVLIG